MTEAEIVDFTSPFLVLRSSVEFENVNITMVAADSLQAINLVTAFRNYGNEVKILNSYLLINWFVSFTSTSARITVEDSEIYAHREAQRLQILFYHTTSNLACGEPIDNTIILRRNKIPLLDIDVEGMLDIRKNIK